MGSEALIVARTDTYSGKFIDNNIDKLDHPFILGVTDPAKPTELKTMVKAGRAAIEKMEKSK